MKIDLREGSRREWTSVHEGNPSLNEIDTGCLLRIADAVEIMAQDYRKLLADRDHYQQWWKDERQERRRLNARISALKGVITKIKRRQA